MHHTTTPRAARRHRLAAWRRFGAAKRRYRQRRDAAARQQRQHPRHLRQHPQPQQHARPLVRSEPPRALRGRLVCLGCARVLTPATTLETPGGVTVCLVCRWIAARRRRVAKRRYRQRRDAARQARQQAARQAREQQEQGRQGQDRQPSPAGAAARSARARAGQVERDRPQHQGQPQRSGHERERAGDRAARADRCSRAGGGRQASPQPPRTRTRRQQRAAHQACARQQAQQRQEQQRQQAQQRRRGGRSDGDGGRGKPSWPGASGGPAGRGRHGVVLGRLRALAGRAGRRMALLPESPERQFDRGGRGRITVAVAPGRPAPGMAGIRAGGAAGAGRDVRDRVAAARGGGGGGGRVVLVWGTGSAGRAPVVGGGGVVVPARARPDRADQRQGRERGSGLSGVWPAGLAAAAAGAGLGAAQGAAGALGAARAPGATASATAAGTTPGATGAGWGAVGMIGRRRPDPRAADPRPHQRLRLGRRTTGTLAVVLLAGLVWLTGQLAGLLFGHAWLRLDAAELAATVVKLPLVLDDPRRAWPDPAQAELPGPAGMYTAAAVALGATLAAAIGALKFISALVGRLSGRPHTRAARWAAAWELRRVLRFTARPRPGRLLLGRWRRWLPVVGEDCQSLVVFGPSGSFKTVALIVPAVLDWPGPVVTTSIKPDVLHATLQARAARGTVTILDPLGVSGLPSARWTPLAGCRTFAVAQATAAAIAAASDPADSPRGASPDYRYWISLAEKLLAPILFAAANAGAPMAKVVSLVDRRDEHDEVAGILADLGDPQAADAWLASLDRLDKAADSVWSTCEDLLRVYADARVTQFTSDHDLDLDAFLDGTNTLYLYAPAADQRRLRPLFETILAQLLAHAQQRAARSPGGLLDPRLLLALDEAGNVAAIADLPELATTARGQGIQLLTVWHDLSQLEARYGQRAATVVNNHRAKLLLGGIADAHTLETCSRLLGERAVWELARSRHRYGRSTATEATGYRPLLSIDELRRLPRLTAVLVYGSLRPARLRLRPWFAWVERRHRARYARRLLRPVPPALAAGSEPTAAGPPSPATGSGSLAPAPLRVAELPPVADPEPAVSGTANGNGHAPAGRGGERRGA